MSRSRVLLSLVLSALAPVVSAEPRRPAGEIRTEEGRTEVLSEPVRAGRVYRLPEGYLRVEEDGPEERRVGSFTVVPARTLTATADALGGGEPSAAPGPSAARAPAAPAPDRAPALLAACAAERAAYLRELWKTSGVEIADPVALLAGLEGERTGAALGFYWFALATDPVRPLAWSSDLRDRAGEVIRCVRQAQEAAERRGARAATAGR
jgi:hypothetical protein